MLRVIPADTSSDNPAQAASVTRRLITESGAVVLVGSHGSTMTLSAQIEAERAGVPILTTSYADQIVQRGYRFTFKLPGQAGSFARANIDYLRVIYAEAGRKLQRVAVFYGSDAGNSAGGKAALDYLKTTSLEIVAGGAVPANLTDPTPVVGPVLASKPDLLIANLFTPDLLLVIHALRAIGVAVPVLTSGSGVSVRSVPQALGAEANGFMGTIAWADDLPIAGVADFKAAFLAAYPGQTFAPQEAGEGYAIGQIIAAALEQAASTDPARIRDALAQISVPTIMPGGPVEFDANGLNKHAVPILVEWEDGVLRSVWPKDYQVAKPLLD
jgi:branched-chain amino acid transport system substrate-binding protein